MNTLRKLLIIAGSDSYGGAGIQADINIARLLDVYPLTAISCLTAQSPEGLSAIEPASESIFRAQLSSSLKCGEIDAVKIGMIPSDSLLKILIRFLSENAFKNVVVDPIMAPTAGRENLKEPLWHNPVLLLEAAPYISLLTPNLPEAIEIASLLTDYLGEEFNRERFATSNPSAQDIEALGRLILGLSGLKAILIKGGHAASEGDEAVIDTLIDSETEKAVRFGHPLIKTLNTHGTGCNLSSAIACYLSKGYRLTEAVEHAEKLIYELLRINKDVRFMDGGCNGSFVGPVAIFNPTDYK